MKLSAFQLPAILLMATGNLFAQESDGLEVPWQLKDRIVAPSPEAAGMNRYQDMPVSYASGTVEVSVPLVGWEVGDYPVSIGLSYHTGGVKPSDAAGPVGLGWSLTGLGHVSRSVVGFPDEDESKNQDYTPWKHNSVSSLSLDEIKHIVEHRQDTGRDRYNYDIPGYSGRFIIDGNKIQQLPPTDLEIRTVPDVTQLKGHDVKVPEISEFTILTPDGITYRFTERDSMSYTFRPDPAPSDGFNLDYGATSTWYLTEIITAEQADTISIGYRTVPEWRRRPGSDLMVSRSILNGRNVSTGSSENMVTSTSDTYTTFHNQRIPSSIVSRTGTVTFTAATGANQPEYGPDTRLTGLSLKNNEGRTVMTVTFDNSLCEEWKRLRLNSVSIMSDNCVIGRKEFAYYPGGDPTKNTDFFGFSNGKERTVGSSSVLDRNGRVGATRLYDFRSAVGGTLMTITDFSGMRTSLTYEPSVTVIHRDNRQNKAPATGTGGDFVGGGGDNDPLRPVDPGNPGDPSNIEADSVVVAIGFRIKSIQAYDTVTGRDRTRTFSYSDAVTTTDLSRVGRAAFISLSGVQNTSALSQMAYSTTQSLSATMTAGSRIPGFPIENTMIYYGKVSEVITGSLIDKGVRTDFEYDLSDCVHDFHYGGQGLNIAAPIGNEMSEYLGLKNFYTGVTSGNIPDFMRVFEPQIVDIAFDEKISSGPVMKRRVDYEWRDGDYRPVVDRVYAWKCVDKTGDIPVGINCESLVYKVGRNNVPGNSENRFEKRENINTILYSLSARRAQCDSVVTVKYFPDGASRTTVMRNYYSAPVRTIDTFVDTGNGSKPVTLQQTVPVFATDSVNNMIVSRVTPLMVTVRCGSHSMTKKTLESERMNGKSQFYSAACSRGLRHLPVMTRWIVDGADSLTVAMEYARFGQHGLTRPTRITLGRNDSTLIAVQRMTAYDGRGLLTREIKTDGTAVSYTHDAVSGCLLTATVDSLALTTTYTHIPLVGCTSIVTPSGKKTSYYYKAGRLSQTRRTSGAILARYEYGFVGEGNRANYVETITPTQDYDEMTVRQYYDGFGMPVASALRGGADNGASDLVTVTMHDGLDRPVRSFLPVPSDDDSLFDGNYLDYDRFGATVSECYGDSHPYSYVTYVPGAADSRPLSASPAGQDVADHPARTSYVCNTLSLPLKCDRYEISGGYLVNRGPYRPGELDVTVAADADGHTVRTFTDWRGNKVLERRHDGENYMDTYYVNDVWGKPLAVIQPEGSAKLRRQGYRWSLDTDETLQRWAAVYTYDDCRRLQSRRLPGQDKVTFSYDAFGRVAFSQDGNQRARGRKSFMLYDEGGRCVMTGEVNASALSGRKIPAMKARFDAGSSGIGGTHYVADGCGLGIIMIPKALTVTYWDDYSRIDSLREFKCLSRFHFRPFDWMSDGKGLPVATLTATLTGDSGDNSSGKSRPGSGILYLGQSGMLPRLTYYDRDERVVQEIESVDGDSTIITADYGFTPLGVVSRVIGNVYRGNRRYTDDTCFYWDDYNRQTRTTVRIGQTTLTSTMSYDRLGRLVGEERPGGVSVSYGYNIRGQIETLSAGSYFSQRLHYTSVNLGRRCYNGNIARIDYPALPGSDEPARSALFTYDPAGRLSEATLPVGSGSYEYDLNSNLVGIIRVGDVGGGVRDEIDNLTIELDGNRLRKVTDSADEVLVAGSADFHDGADEDIEYTYDANGNLTGDLNKGISTIGYDISGQTSHVVFDNGDRLVYTHDASGRKLATSLYRYETRLVPEKPIVGVGLDGGNVAGGRIGSSVIIPEPKDTVNITIQGRTVLAEKRDYVGAYEFKCDTLVRFNTEVGYWDGNRFHTYIHDYQGNVARVVADGKVIQRNDYYPYGMPAASSTGAEANAYRYGGKEFESRHGLNIYDYEARWMDHALGRFNAPDILAENDLGISPYTYCGGDPVNRIDPTGMKFTSGAEDIISVLTEKANLYIQECENDIEHLKTDTDKSKIDELSNKISEYKSVLSEIDVLRNSDQLYDIIADNSTIVTSASPYGGIEKTEKPYSALFIKGNDNVFEMHISPGNNSLGWIAHELKHAYQFETGDFSTTSKKNGTPFYDKQDEIEAYQRGSLFGIRIPSQLDPIYSALQDNKSSVGISYPFSSPENLPGYLQILADKNKAAFRYNGTTYVGKNYENPKK